MNDLIPVSKDKTCLASDLHIFLETNYRFWEWSQRYILDDGWGFREGADYSSLTDFSVKPQGGRPKKDYELTVSCAKEISMLQRTPKGKEARKYFLRIEAKYLNKKDNWAKETAEFLVANKIDLFTDNRTEQKIKTFTKCINALTRARIYKKAELKKHIAFIAESMDIEI